MLPPELDEIVAWVAGFKQLALASFLNFPAGNEPALDGVILPQERVRKCSLFSTLRCVLAPDADDGYSVNRALAIGRG